MKKNKAMRMASALLVCVLLTTSVVSGTFAKYVTSNSAKDTARVANWGITITTSGSLYSDAYAKKTNSNVPTTWTQPSPNADSITVNSGEQYDNIVAPGTNNGDTPLTFGITGTPEVAFELSAKVDAEDIYLAAGTYGRMVVANITSDDFASMVESGLYTKSADTYTKVTNEDWSGYTTYYKFDSVKLESAYYPVQYSLTCADTNNNKTNVTAATIATELMKELTGENVTYNATNTTATKVKTYAANTDLSDTSKLNDFKITWKWDFDDTTNSHDMQDTLLGDMMANNVSGWYVKVGDNLYPITVSNNAATANGKTVANLHTTLGITLTATQVD